MNDFGISSHIPNVSPQEVHDFTMEEFKVPIYERHQYDKVGQTPAPHIANSVDTDPRTMDVAKSIQTRSNAERIEVNKWPLPRTRAEAMKNPGNIKTLQLATTEDVWRHEFQKLIKFLTENPVTQVILHPIQAINGAVMFVSRRLK
jgi:hypothetical protein